MIERVVAASAASATAAASATSPTWPRFVVAQVGRTVRAILGIAGAVAGCVGRSVVVLVARLAAFPRGMLADVGGCPRSVSRLLVAAPRGHLLGAFRAISLASSAATTAASATASAPAAAIALAIALGIATTRFVAITDFTGLGDRRRTVVVAIAAARRTFGPSACVGRPMIVAAPALVAGRAVGPRLRVGVAGCPRDGLDGWPRSGPRCRPHIG